MTTNASEVQGAGRWVHCSPALINSGVSCAYTPRRVCQCNPESGGHDHFISHTAPATEVKAEGVPEAYQQFLDDTKDAALPWARRALVTAIAECQTLSYSEDRGITVSEAESIAGVLHELRRLQNLESEAVAIVTSSVEPEAAPVDSFARLIAFHAEQIDSNPYCYFELAYTHVTGWMAWVTDRPAQGEPGTPAYAKSRKVIARGQGDTPIEACADALSAIDAPASSAGDQP